MDRTLRSMFLLLLGCMLFLLPESLLADSKASNHHSKNRTQRIPARSPAEGLKTGAAKKEWQRLRLLALSRRLDRDLADFKSASQWKYFLRLPQEVATLKNTGSGSRDEHSLKTSLHRYKLIAEESRYQEIASLPSFKAMHLALQRYSDSHTVIDSQPFKSPVVARPEKKKQQWVDLENLQTRSDAIDRLPPVLISGAKPDLRTPPDLSHLH